jgi:hypothetical protein
MRRGALVALAVGVVAFLIVIILWAATGITMMPSYLAAWLFWIALPFGALPLLMALELAGAGWSAPVVLALRRLLILAPLAAVLIVPVLVRMHALYAWAEAPRSPGLAGIWLAHNFFILRSTVYLGIWVALSLVFARAPSPLRMRRRSMAAVIGLILYVVVATLASIDWAMSFDIHLHSSEFGLLFIAAQCGIALCVAILLSLGRFRAAAMPGEIGTMLLGLVAAWAFLHFMQYLVVWSADLPKEIVWYLKRDSGGGRAAEWIALVLGFVVPFFVLLSEPLRRGAGTLVVLAGLILVAHLLEMLWLVTPSFRQHFSISGPDVLAMLGIGGITVGCLLALEPRQPAPAPGQVRHG